MCIIADPPTLIPIFKQTDPEHKTFSAVLEWVMKGGGKFVIGGTKYTQELAAVRSIIPFMQELARQGKIFNASSDAVDKEEANLKAICPEADFDDPHLVALVKATGCRLICIRDPRAHRYLRMSKLYRSPSDRPKLYTREKNKNILCQNNVATCCKGVV